MEHTLADTVASRRFNLYALGTFAGAAVLLALIGVYGVTAYSVARRRHELGVRMALGAQRGDVVRLVLGEGPGAMVAGLAIGLLAAIGLTRVMDSLLYGVTPTDPQTFLAVSGLLVVSTLMACGVPALKATRVDALRELRNE
jgi:ABC-type antimicrobial peptide transport system permease subunit